MKSKLMALAFVAALALSASAQNAAKGVGGNAIGKSATAVSTSKRLPPNVVRRQASSTSVPSHATNGKKK